MHSGGWVPSQPKEADYTTECWSAIKLIINSINSASSRLVTDTLNPPTINIGSEHKTDVLQIF